MRFVVFGAGAVGCALAGLMHKGGLDVSLFARGATLRAIKTHGLLFRENGKTETLSLVATDQISQAANPDWLILTAKAHQLPAAAQTIASLIGPNTQLVTIVNGIPWWYSHALGGKLEGRHPESVDPGGVVWNAIGPERTLGCVTNVAADMPNPGEVHHNYAGWYRLGEPTGGISPRLESLVSTLQAAGVEAVARENLREDVWYKLWGNATFNPVSALTGAMIDRIANDPKMVPAITAWMQEVAEVAAAYGITSLTDIPNRLVMSRALGPVKTSMLQDLERGKEMEIGPLLSSVIELGEWKGLPCPKLRLLEAMILQKQSVADEQKNLNQEALAYAA